MPSNVTAAHPGLGGNETAKSEAHFAKEWNQLDAKDKLEVVTTAKEWLEEDTLCKADYANIVDTISQHEETISGEPFSSASLTYEEGQSFRAKAIELKKKLRTVHSTLVVFSVKLSKRKAIPG